MLRNHFLLFLFSCSFVAQAEVLLFEDFEDSILTYTTNIPEFSDSESDYFGRIAPDALSVASTVAFNNQQGIGYFAAMDTDAPEGSEADGVVNFSINIFGYQNLRFSGLFAEDAAADGNPDWDSNSSVIVSYTIDEGIEQTILAFASTGGTNSAAALDTNFDGVGDGTLLSDSFNMFSSSIIDSGNILDISIRINNLDAGDEDIAFDNILIEGDLVSTPVPLPASVWLMLSSLMGLMASHRHKAPK